MQLIGNGSTVPALDSDLLLSASCLLFACGSVCWLLERSLRHGGSVKLKRAVQALPILTAEFLGLAALSVLVVALLSRGKNLGSPISTSEDKLLWDGMATEWPVLQTADTLLAIQAMLRFLLVFSLAFRPDSLGVPLSGSAALFLFFAGICRVSILVLSPPEVYHYDGPLGGALNTLFEMAVLPPLLYLGLVLDRPSLLGGVMIIGVAPAMAWLALRNRFALADDSQGYLDTLFSLAQLLELLVATTVLGRTLRSVVLQATDNANAETASTVNTYIRACFAHGLLPIQALLAAYFHLVAFAPPSEAPAALVRAGSPFEMLRVGGVVQVGMYVLASALHFSCGADVLEKGNVLLDV